MTVKDMAAFIGRRAWLDADGLDVDVIIHDMRSSYGEVQAHVQPWSGTRSKWVAFTRLQVKAAWPEPEGARR